MGDRDKEKNNKTDNPLSPQTSERSRKLVAQWNRNLISSEEKPSDVTFSSFNDKPDSF